MTCRHHASQLASVGQLLEVGPWAAQPSVESAGGMVNLPRWTAEQSRPRPAPKKAPCAAPHRMVNGVKLKTRSSLLIVMHAVMCLVLSVRSTRIEMHRYECEVKKLDERIRKIEERMEEWSQGGQDVNSVKEDGNGANWEHDGRRVGGMERMASVGRRVGAVGRRMVAQSGKIEPERTTEEENITRFAATDRARAKRSAETLARVEKRDVEGK